MRTTTRLRKLLEGPRILLAPGAYDALSAKLIQQAGFEAVYMTGAGVTISLLGEPDVGFTTMTEMVDQAAPKKCGHFAGKRLVSAEEMAGKIAAAVEARRDPDFVLIGQVDARAIHGIEEAIRRGQIYRKAGADVIFIEAPASSEELRLIGQSFDCPLEEIKRTGTTQGILDQLLSFEGRNQITGLSRIYDLECRFLPRTQK